MHMVHMGMAKSTKGDQPICVDQAKSKSGWKSQVGGCQSLRGGCQSLWGGCKRRPYLTPKHCVYYLVCNTCLCNYLSTSSNFNRLWVLESCHICFFDFMLRQDVVHPPLTSASCCCWCWRR